MFGRLVTSRGHAAADPSSTSRSIGCIPGSLSLLVCRWRTLVVVTVLSAAIYLSASLELGDQLLLFRPSSVVARWSSAMTGLSVGGGVEGVGTSSAELQLMTENVSSSSLSSSTHYFSVDANDTDGFDRLYNQLDFLANHDNRTAKNRTTKYILRVGNFNWEDWLEGRERFIVDKCPVKDCWLTSDGARASTADALLISQINGDAVKSYLPKPAHQIWIVKHMESPMHNRVDPSALRGLANWTMSYRHAATMYGPYYPAFGRKDRVDRRYHFDVKQFRSAGANFASGKTKKVAWFVSNCGAHNGRREYAAELGKYIDVDVYGACGKMSCPKSECRAMLSRDYKFYLSFENSNCVEYITEKLSWQALTTDVVPIVMGARPEDYAGLAPPGSYIHVDDFRSPRQLADYLRVLDRNDTLYNEYFRWRQTWTAINDPYWCRLCAMLHVADDIGLVTWYPDYTDWWNGACHAHRSENGPWQTWRPPGYWTALNRTSLFNADGTRFMRSA